MNSQETQKGRLTDTGALLPAFHQILLAHELTLRRAAHDAKKLNQTLTSAIVDLNPHQIEAALYAFRSPLSRGALLADEVGLGKTIEAGLIISQLWAEGKRKIIIVVPASLRKQWQNELFDKFDLPSIVVDGKEYRTAKKEGLYNPFERDVPIIISMPFAYAKRAEISPGGMWDLIVIDEAHRLRNVYKKGNKQAKGLKELFAQQPKILLTATPLQNSLMELYGLASFIDDKLLGTDYSFKSKFMADSRGLEAQNIDELKARVNQIAIRALRSQVQEYIRYTNRIPMVEDFTPTDEEFRLYNMVSEYLQRPALATIKRSQSALMILIYRKILASSSFAIANTLQKLINNLDRQLSGLEPEPIENLIQDMDGYEEEKEELGRREDGEVLETDEDDQTTEAGEEKTFTKEEIEAEKQELIAFKNLAQSIQKNAKGDALLAAIQKAFEHNRKMGWPEKAVIFTESRRTQNYLFQLLSQNGYDGQITLFSGTNEGEIGKRAYALWEREQAIHEKARKLSKEAVIREALIYEFKKNTKIFIATEAGSEGINLQFCNLVINYDLPWNPQRIEQRIGRCHRYGQKHDVVVLNFVNRRNAADRRIYELLDQKLKLFRGVFGASDEVLGAIGSGVDFEKRILEIYQSCRTEEAINQAFDQLQRELSDEIKQAMLSARAKILEHFDDEVRDKLKITDRTVKGELSALELMMAQLLLSVLKPVNWKEANGNYYFKIDTFPMDITLSLPGDVKSGEYYIGRSNDQETAVRLHMGHPLVTAVIRAIQQNSNGKSHSLSLHYTEGKHKITPLESYREKSGYWIVCKFTFEGLEVEEHLVHLAFVQDGVAWKTLPQDLSQKLAGITASECKSPLPLQPPPDELIHSSFAESEQILEKEIGHRNEEYYDRELDKLDLFSEEALMKMQDDLRRKEEEYREAKRKRQRALSFEERQQARKEINKLEQEYSHLADKIAEEKKKLFEEKNEAIKRLEKKLKLRVDRKIVCTAFWEMR